MRGAKFAVLLAALILGPAMACASEEGSISLRDLSLRDKLELHIDVALQAVTVRELLQQFRERLKINVVLDNTASALGDRLITLQLKDVRAQDALTWTLRQVGLQYTLMDGIVIVADRQRAEAVEPMTLRQYDVADLLVIP